MKKSGFIIVMLLVLIPVFGIENFKSSELGVCEFFRESNALSFPILDINDGEKLELRFDIFSSRKEILNYEIVLCDFNWEPVNLGFHEYLEGFPDNTFQSFSFSINTTFDYVHYRLNIPNNDIQILKPGNYAVSVFREGQKETPLLIRRFIVYKKLAEVSVLQNLPASEYLQQFQEFSVNVEAIDNAGHELSRNMQLVLIQNNDWSTARVFGKFNSRSASTFTFDSPGQIVFPGRNEFRYFDTKSLKHISERIKRIEYQPPYYHVWLKPDLSYGSKQYFTSEDLSGLFFIDNTDTDAQDITDADYVYVHFELEAKTPFASEVYIDGALTDWKFDSNRMEYDLQCACYKKELLLKQGLHNYRYALKDNNQSDVYFDLTEGEHYETQNAYIAIIYYQPAGEIYYQPVGVGVWPL